MNSACIEVGISGEERPSPALTCWETQSHAPWGGTRILIARLPCRGTRSAEFDWKEWGRAQSDVWRELDFSGILFRVPPSLSGLFTARDAERVLSTARLGCEFWIDDPEPARSIDPMVRRNPRSTHWKVHGWHPERWRQRYGLEELEELARRALRFRPRTVVFAHPTREEQAEQFRAILEKLA